MVNRILIRIKVVQMLYSYLLTRSDFQVLPPVPETASKERKYAYSLYQDLLLLILELTGRDVQPGKGVNFRSDVKLVKMALGRGMYENSAVRRLIANPESHIADFNDVLPHLLYIIQESQVFKDYKKLRQPSVEDDVKMVNALLQTVFLTDKELLSAYRKNPDFTFTGLDRAVAMAVESLNQFCASTTALKSAQTDLQNSLQKAYDLYVGMFALIVNLTDLQRKVLEKSKNKYLATAEDLNPNPKFVNNQLAAFLEKNQIVAAWMDKHGAGWQTDPLLLRRLLDDVLKSEQYAAYMANPEGSFSEDCEFWRDVLKNVIFDSEALEDELERESVFWNDDLPTMSTFVLKTIRKIGQDPEHADLLDKYKDDEDAVFGAQLFTKAVENYDLYRSYIEENMTSTNWEPERVAFMDVVIMVAAIAEMIEYDKIPLPVTMNEYVEIANHYSTNRSGHFINGILYSVAEHLREKGIMHKQ